MRCKSGSCKGATVGRKGKRHGNGADSGCAYKRDKHLKGFFMQIYVECSESDTCSTRLCITLHTKTHIELL